MTSNMVLGAILGLMLLVLGADAWVRGLKLRRYGTYLYEIAAGRMMMFIGLLYMALGGVLATFCIASLVT